VSKDYFKSKQKTNKKQRDLLNGIGMAVKSKRCPTSYFLIFSKKTSPVFLKGLWVWTDGSAWDYEDWGPNQPDNRPGEDCLDLAVDDAQFHDTQCTWVAPYVCKI
jgi:hypothetical protein